MLIYDGECDFCGLWIRRWRELTGDRVAIVALQEPVVPELYPEIGREDLEYAVHLVDSTGRIYRGAEAVFRALATNPTQTWLLRLYEKAPLAALASESAYGFVAGHRTLFSRLTRLLWGRQVERPGHYLVRRLFLRVLGAIYLVAFASLWLQVSGLIGKEGIVPAANLMSEASRFVDAQAIGVGRFHLLPTFCWFNSSDWFLRLQCGAGWGLSLLLIAGMAPPLCLALLWALYLSLTSVGSDFLAFQWDNLLLETGFLAIFFGPFQWLPRRSKERAPSGIVLWLLRLLLFKLMFLSGVVKLASGDTAWRNLSALSYHYQTQPLPTWIAWYASQFPLWFQKASCALMFAIELAAPFLIFLPRRARMSGAIALAALQVFILLTGNYTFFNWLTLALCLLLCDDFLLARVWPQNRGSPCEETKATISAWALPGRVATTLVAIVFVGISLLQIIAPFGPLPGWTSPAIALERWLAPFRSVSTYGLFAVMTTERLEIIVEGSTDGRVWKEYDFPYKPGDLSRRPRFVAPFQPRLDWQMWFAALGTYRQNPWFIDLCVRLLQGSPEVLALMKGNPFPTGPPKYVRAQLYDYRFTTPAERARTGAWWKRSYKGVYLPPISLDLLERARSPH